MAPIGTQAAAFHLLSSKQVIALAQHLRQIEPTAQLGLRPQDAYICCNSANVLDD